MKFLWQKVSSSQTDFHMFVSCWNANITVRHKTVYYCTLAELAASFWHNQFQMLPFYHAMLALLSQSSLSVTLRYRDHIGWNSSKIISPLVSLGCSLLTDPTSQIYSKGNTLNFDQNRGEISKKWLSAYKSSNISEERQDKTKVTTEDQ